MSWRSEPFFRSAARRIPVRSYGTSSRAYEPVEPKEDLDEQPEREWPGGREAAPPVDRREAASPFDRREAAPPFDRREAAPPFDRREAAPPFDVADQSTPAAAADAASVDAELDDLRAAKLRLERERDRVLAETRATVVREMLPVLDNLDRSLAGASGTSDPAFVEGVRLVRSQFEGALARLGLERIESLGRPFDPQLFDAVAVLAVDDPKLAGTVTDEWQRGYKLGDTIVSRPKVRVGKFAA